MSAALPHEGIPPVVYVARCPEHGLHGERDTCFVCDGPVEKVAMQPVPSPGVRADGWEIDPDDFKQAQELIAAGDTDGIAEFLSRNVRARAEAAARTAGSEEENPDGR